MNNIHVADVSMLDAEIISYYCVLHRKLFKSLSFPDWLATEKMLDDDILEGYQAVFQNKIAVLHWSIQWSLFTWCLK